MMKTDLHKKAGHTGAPRLRLPKKAPVEPEKDTANPYRMPPRRWFSTYPPSGSVWAQEIMGGIAASSTIPKAAAAISFIHTTFFINYSSRPVNT